MGLPLPPSTQYKVQHTQQTGDEDWAKLTPQDIMARQWAAYEGLFKHPLRRDDPRGIDHNVVINRCEPIVSTGVDLLLGDGVQFEVMQEGAGADPASPDEPDEAAQDYLDKALAAQPLGKMPTLASDEINAAVFGHHFINLVPDDPDTAPYPSLAVLNPHQMRVETDPADYRKCLSYDFRWPDFDEKQQPIERRKLVVRDTQGGGWTIYEQERAQDTVNQTSLYGEVRPSIDPQAGWTNTGKAIAWQRAWPPIHDGPNMVQPNVYWGKADLRLDLIHLNDVLNLNLSNLNRIIFFYAHPRDIFFGARGTDIEVAPNESMNIPNVNAKVQRLEMGGDIPAISTHIDRLMESMDEESHIPSVAVGRLRNLPAIPSGVALKVAMQPAIMQTGQKRQLREVFYTQLCQHILELGGYGEKRKIVIHWAQLLPVDDYQEAQTAVLYHGLGASKDTLLQRGGFDPDVEAEKRAQEDAQAVKQAQQTMQQQPQEQGTGSQQAFQSNSAAAQPGGSAQASPAAAGGPAPQTAERS